MMERVGQGGAFSSLFSFRGGAGDGGCGVGVGVGSGEASA